MGDERVRLRSERWKLVLDLEDALRRSGADEAAIVSIIAPVADWVRSESGDPPTPQEQGEQKP